MTVGNYENEYGYSNIISSIYIYGSLFPPNSDILSIMWNVMDVDPFSWLQGYVGDFIPIEFVSINGVIYNLIDGIGGIANPFPPAGQTCEIKLKYTLA